MKILFINGSPNKEGNTKKLADALLSGKEYETINLTDLKIYSYGQNYEDDELGVVIDKMKKADTIVIGSPLYWHNICGSVRNVLDRFYGLVSESELQGRDMYFLRIIRRNLRKHILTNWQKWGVILKGIRSLHPGM